MRSPVYNTESFPSAPRTVPGLAVADTEAHYSGVWDIGGAEGFGLHIRTTGNLTGAWTLWRSGLPDPSLANDDDWDEEDEDFTPTDPAGSATNWATDVPSARVHLWRLKFVAASGSGSIFCDVDADPSGR